MMKRSSQKKKTQLTEITRSKVTLVTKPLECSPQALNQVPEPEKVFVVVAHVFSKDVLEAFDDALELTRQSQQSTVHTQVNVRV